MTAKCESPKAESVGELKDFSEGEGIDIPNGNAQMKTLVCSRRSRPVSVSICC